MALQQAREFMARVVPWPAVEHPGFVSIHWSYKPAVPDPKKPDKLAWSGRAVLDTSEFTRTLAWAMGLKDVMGFYVCMAQTATVDNRVSKRGKPYKNPIRRQDNAAFLKSFFLDIDVKPGAHGYATDNELMDALAKFIHESGLPRPTMVVSTGGGYHVYWCVDRALTPNEWYPYAVGLAEATKHFGLKCDTQCTVDSVRIMRIPDTFNRKKEPHRQVVFAIPPLDFDYSLERITQPLERFKGRHTPSITGVDFNLFPRRAAVLDASELGNGLGNMFPPVDLDLVLPACGFLADVVATGGAGISNPLWNLTTLISTFTKGGRNDAHRMGCKHADYTKETTDEFYDRKVREQTERGLGWPSCATISATGASACKNCALFAQGKSPLNFEQKPLLQYNASVVATAPAATGSAQPAAPVVPAQQAGATAAGPVTPQGNDLPAGYARNSANQVCKIEIDPSGNGLTIYTPISDYPMLNAWLQTDPKILHFETVVERGRKGTIDLPLEIIATNEMRKQLQAQGFMLNTNDKSSGDFFVAWVKQLQRSRDAVASAPFGWQDKNGQTEGFIYGNAIWTPAGSSPSANANPTIDRQYRPKGSASYWTAAANLITAQHRPDLEAIVASAFAAPLVMFTGHMGMLMSAFSKESGIGKTTAVRIAQAVWGDPITAVQSLNDTQNSVMNKIGCIRSLPVYWDELKTEEDTKKFVNMTFQIAQGKEKSRLTSQVAQREPGHWQTLVVSASNESLIDHVTAQTQTTLAGLYRIFEYTVAPLPQGAPGRIDTSEATIILSKLHTNYGMVGLLYAQFLGTNYKRIAVEMKDLSKQLNAETNSLQEERFWISLIACILLGARYACELNLIQFDEVALKAFMFKALDEMRAQRAAQTVDMTQTVNVSSIMASFMRDMQREGKILTTNRIHIAVGRPPAPNSLHAIKIIAPADISRLNGVVVQIGKDDKLMRIAQSALGEWLKKTGKNRNIVLSAIKAKVASRNVIGFLAGGTTLAGPKENCVEIDLSSSPEFDFIDQYQ